MRHVCVTSVRVHCCRSKELDRDTEHACSTAMLQGVGVQALVTEFLIQFTDVIFDDKLQTLQPDDRDMGKCTPLN